MRFVKIKEQQLEGGYKEPAGKKMAEMIDARQNLGQLLSKMVGSLTHGAKEMPQNKRSC